MLLFLLAFFYSKLLQPYHVSETGFVCFLFYDLICTQRITYVRLYQSNTYVNMVL